MAEVLICFTVAAIASFIGSLQLGPVNLRVIHASHTYSKSDAMLVATGGVLPEIIYSAMAFWFAGFFMNNEKIFLAIRVVAVVFFLTSGIILFFKKKQNIRKIKIQKTNLFLNGFISAMLNPLLFTFWLMIISYFSHSELFSLQSSINKIAFVTGTACGAFALLYLFAYFTSKNKNRLETLTAGNFDKPVGAFFIILAGAEIIRLLI